MRARAFARAATAAAALGLILAATGCTASAHANLTASPNGFEKQVGDALTKQVGTKAEVDCGSEQIDLVDGNAFHCKVWPKDAPKPAQVADATVTLSNVKGTKYHFDIAVAQKTIAADADLPKQTK